MFTKCSLVWNTSGEIGHSLKAASIRHECEQSLRRLKVDTIDLYQIHWPIPDEDIEQAWTGAGSLTLPVCRNEELSDLAPVRHGKGIRASMAYVVDDLKTLKNLEK